MVIHKDRNTLISIINDYLHEKISAFQFDDQLSDLENSRDATVVLLREDLWCYYDDCKDHKIVASKELWDYLQRILLLLHTDIEIKVIKTRQWHYTQLVAAFFFALSASVFIFIGNVTLAIFFCALLWPFSYLISRCRCDEANKKCEDATWDFCFPYENIRQLLACRRKVPLFKKESYPQRLSQRMIRSRILEIGYWIPMFFIWACFCPLALLYQAIPPVRHRLVLIDKSEDGNGHNNIQ